MQTSRNFNSGGHAMTQAPNDLPVEAGKDDEECRPCSEQATTDGSSGHSHGRPMPRRSLIRKGALAVVGGFALSFLPPFRGTNPFSPRTVRAGCPDWINLGTHARCSCFCSQNWDCFLVYEDACTGNQDWIQLCCCLSCGPCDNRYLWPCGCCFGNP